MLLDLFGLIGAYAAGSCRDVTTSIYVIALAGAVFIYVVIHIVFFTLESQEKDDTDKLDKRREILLLLAILVAALTYQAGLTPPGGFWSEDDINSGHRAGFPILLDSFAPRYRIFFYTNAMSFMASVALIVLLVNPNLYRPGIRCFALYVCMVAGMFGLMGAYAAGSSRSLRTSIYVITLVAAVFAFVILQVVIFWASDRKKEKPVQPVEETGNEPQDEVENPEEKKQKDLREYLMLLGVLAASVTYQTGLKPPGGLWEDNSNEHTAGNSILHDINRSRYHAFFYCNSTSFMASIVVVVLLLPKTLHNSDYKLWPMHTAIVLNMLGLLGAYAAGSTRDWEMSRTIIWLAIPALLVCYAVCSFYWKKCRDAKETQRQQPSDEGA
jgi:heme/copper-type cytochrome/quinol oxidase subunit 2